VIGPAVQIHFWRMLFLDAKGLYSRVDYTHSGSGGDGHTLVDLKAVDRWEVPILLKAQLNSWHVVHPYVAGGVSFEYSQGFFQPKTVLGVVGRSECRDRIDLRVRSEFWFASGAALARGSLYAVV